MTTSLCCASTSRRLVGQYPPVVARIPNQGTTLAVALLGDPGTRGELPRRRAWFVPPAVDGAPVTVAIETTRQNLGISCDAPPCGALTTPYAGAGAPVPQSTPCLLQIDNAVTEQSFLIGCDEDEDGALLYTATPGCTAGPATSSWLQLTGTNPLQPYIAYGIANAATTSDGRALYAQPTLTPDVYRLAWQAPETAVGTPCGILLVYPSSCPPCATTATVRTVTGAVTVGPS